MARIEQDRSEKVDDGRLQEGNNTGSLLFGRVLGVVGALALAGIVYKYFSNPKKSQTTPH